MLHDYVKKCYLDSFMDMGIVDWTAHQLKAGLWFVL